MVHNEGGNAAEDAARRRKGGIRFVIFSRQRSASTTFVGLLNLHPNVTCRWESFSNSYTATKMRAFLGIANRSEQLADVPRFMRRFWDACPTSACGFKLLNAQIRPIDRVGQIFTPTGDEGREDAVPVHRLLLERADINAEFDSWRRAQSTGNWGTSPEAQARFGTALASAKQNGSTVHMAFRGCRGCDPEAVARNQAMANAIGPARFAYQHRAWFRFAREVAPQAPLLHLYSENITRSLRECNQTMERVYTFLGLPPLHDNVSSPGALSPVALVALVALAALAHLQHLHSHLVRILTSRLLLRPRPCCMTSRVACAQCNISAVPIEWPCDIKDDPKCSLEKYDNASAHD